MESVGITYLQLTFVIKMREACTLPRAKASMLRGGIGDILLKKYCLKNGACEDCSYHEDCLVQRIMYSSFAKAPSFMGENASLGYVVFCDDYREAFGPDDEMSFDIILFGRETAYVGVLADAVMALAETGLSDRLNKFDLVQILGRTGHDIRESDGYLDPEECESRLLDDYIEHRLERFEHVNAESCLKLEFKNETTLKDRKRELTEFELEPFLRALLLRINLMRQYQLGTSEGVELWEPPEPVPVLISQESKPMSVPRYSGRKQQKMHLKGIKGQMVLKNVSGHWLRLLLAGEILHVGKNTSFGFGKYLVKTEEDE
ncbi:CRISPR system precrRNA processing endoribonuclease RAMP protein Cas6 [Dialister sp.]|uniref:CRISPR system precrRNA processing endoribonuclease RAMP protein Cas6 n=1 Tax=Dialister sp. TaxID=1955814 RepID=UPI002E81E43F|nr:CRISPR system precrRNA processing endoribonuclease RAMP protein Cas6 [Dialister sp.]MEE3453395.1 CRISPR system precrRNA processing endoribonuclease RAMP protein Cas6 [Dialister sp.]